MTKVQIAYQRACFASIAAAMIAVTGLLMLTPSFRIVSLVSSREFGQALAPLSGRNARPWDLSAGFVKNLQAITSSFGTIRDRLFDCLAIGHVSGYVPILRKIAATPLPSTASEP